MKNNIVILIVLFLITGCCRNNPMPLASKTINRTKYLASKQVVTADTMSSLEFIILNNPYRFNDHDTLLIYIGGQLSYLGRYANRGYIQFRPIKQDELIYCWIAVVKGNVLYIIQNKSVFNWNNKFRFLYVGYLPDNEETERIFFIPHENEINR